MSQTIRDVVIRIAVEQRDAKLKAPDMSAWHSAIKDVEDRLNRMKQATASATSGGGVGGAAAGGSPGGAIAQTAQATESNKNLVDMLSRAKKEDAELSAQIRDNARRNALSYKTMAQQAQEQLRASRMQTLETFGALSGSIAQLARGSAFLFASTDDDMRKYLETLARYQGIFDLIAGGSGTIKNAITLWNSLAAAQKASAAAGMAAAAANSLGGSSSVKGFALNVGTSFLENSITDKLFKGIGKYGLPAARLAPVIGAIGYTASSAYESYQESEVRPGERRRSQLEDARRERIQMAQERNANQLETFRTSGRDGDVTSQLFQMGGITYSKAMEEAQSRQTMARWQRTVFEPDPLGGPTHLQNSEQKMIFSEKMRDSYQEMVDYADKYTESLQKQVAVYDNIAEASKKQLEAEQERYEGIEAAIGRMSNADYARLKRIAEAQKEGKELPLEDARFLETTPVGRRQAEARFRREFENRGGSFVTGAFGEDVTLNNLEATNASTQATATQQIEILTKEINRELSKRDENEQKLFSALREYAIARSEFDTISRVVKKLEEDAKRRAAMGR